MSGRQGRRGGSVWVTQDCVNRDHEPLSQSFSEIFSLKSDIYLWILYHSQNVSTYQENFLYHIFQNDEIVPIL